LRIAIVSQFVRGSSNTIGGTFIKKRIFAYKIKLDSKEIHILNKKLSVSFANFEDNAPAELFTNS